MRKKLDPAKLIEHGLLKNVCVICGQGPEWQGKELILVLDYINGFVSDNRLQNLRLLCPNCNSQQYNLLHKKLDENNPKDPCPRCGNPKSLNAKLCKLCSSLKRRRGDWPTREQLQADLREKRCWTALGRKYNVSDNTVRRWAKVYRLV
jgi:ribosomal protein S27AE